jgi:hypothetical protein
MGIEIAPLDFLGQGALLEPVDKPLHDAAYAYCLRELKDGASLNFAQFSKVWVGLKDGIVQGVTGYVLKPDVPLFRATDVDVLRAMGQRLNSYFADNGARGREVLMYIGNERAEQRCPGWRAALKEFGAKSGRRVVFEVK